MPDQLLTIRLALPEVKPLPDFARHTSLLTAGRYAFRSHAPLAFIAPDMTKGADLGNLFGDVVPGEGKLTLELGLALADTLPDIDNLSECTLAVKGPGGEAGTLCLSNRMSRLHFFDGGEPWHCLTPRRADSDYLGLVEVRRSNGNVVPAIEEVLRTVAAMRFDLDGETAEQAFEGTIRAHIDTFLACVNATLAAARASPAGYHLVSRSLVRETAPLLYALVSNGSTTSAQLVGLHGGRFALRPEELKEERAARFRAFAAGTMELTDVDRLLGEARSTWQSGEYEFAFLQAVIAGEIETKRMVRAECLRRGVSKTKLDDSRREMTYSWALNIGLPLALDKSVRPPDALVAQMNSARQRRNDLMHEAAFEMTREEVDSLIERTKDYVTALRKATATLAVGDAPAGIGPER